MKKKANPEAAEFDLVLKRMLAMPPQPAGPAPKPVKKKPVVDRVKPSA